MEEIDMKKKVALTAAAVAMVGTLAVGGTLAWFTDTETATNVVTLGKVDISIWEKNTEGDENWSDADKKADGDGFTYEDLTPGAEITKKVRIHNDGVNSALIKVTVGVPEELLTGTFNVGEGSNWYYDDDTDAYYYIGIVGEGETTDELLSALTVNSTVGNENNLAQDIEIPIHAYAIQADNITYVDVEDGETKNLNDADEITGEIVKSVFDAHNNEIVDLEENAESGDVDSDDAEGGEIL